MLNGVRAEHGLAPLKDYGDQVLGAQAIYVMTAPELDFSSKAQLPANVHYVGPAFEPFQKDWESPWPEENTDPLVLLSFSTSYMDQGALAQRALDAVAGLPVRALLTAGPALDASRLRIPANARTVAFVPHRTVLPHASLMVTHAGWQTVNAALADGVPLVCIPDARDQPDNAARVVFVNAGVRVSKKSSPSKLRSVIAGALEDRSIKQGARAMADALARSDGTTVMADALERLPGGRRKGNYTRWIIRSRLRKRMRSFNTLRGVVVGVGAVFVMLVPVATASAVRLQLNYRGSPNPEGRNMTHIAIGLEEGTAECSGPTLRPTTTIGHNHRRADRRS